MRYPWNGPGQGNQVLDINYAYACIKKCMHAIFLSVWACIVAKLGKRRDLGIYGIKGICLSIRVSQNFDFLFETCLGEKGLSFGLKMGCAKGFFI